MLSRPGQSGSVKREMYDHQKTEPIASRSQGGLLRHCQRWHHEGTASRSTLSPRKTVSGNPAIEGQGFWDQHGAAVVVCEMPLLPVVFQIISTCAVHLPASNGLGLTEDRLRLDRLPATAAASFFPPRVPRFASRSKKAVGGRQALALCPSGAVRSSPVERPPSRSRLARPDWKKEHDNGNHRHLHQDRERLHRHDQNAEPQRQGRSSSPRRATASAAPTSVSSPAPGVRRSLEEDRPRDAARYLSVKLDDPSFPAPIYASLVEAEDGESHNLIWSRRNGD